MYQMQDSLICSYTVWNFICDYMYTFIYASFCFLTYCLIWPISAFIVHVDFWLIFPVEHTDHLLMAVFYA